MAKRVKQKEYDKQSLNQTHPHQYSNLFLKNIRWNIFIEQHREFAVVTDTIGIICFVHTADFTNHFLINPTANKLKGFL